MTDFKPGDRVKVLTFGRSNTGTVLYIQQNDAIVFVKTDVYDRIGFSPSELELIMDTPAFAVGDTVEYKQGGKVEAVFPTGVISVEWDNGRRGSVSVNDFKYMTKVAPPFPTKVGSVIKARAAYGNVRLYTRTNNDDLTWYSVELKAGFPESMLELISVEYEPND